jgi:hypothetical protein
MFTMPAMLAGTCLGYPLMAANSSKCSLTDSCGHSTSNWGHTPRLPRMAPMCRQMDNSPLLLLLLLPAPELLGGGKKKASPAVGGSRPACQARREVQCWC